jgi:hypothetical protein
MPHEAGALAFQAKTMVVMASIEGFTWYVLQEVYES